MSRLALAGFLALAVSVPRTLKADDADSIRAELTTAKKAHADAAAKATASLLAAIDDAIKAVAATGDLEGVKAIQAEKKAFAESGKVPSSLRLRTAAGEYQKITRTADSALDKGYEKAIKDATRALNIDLAEAIQVEWKDMRGKPSVPHATVKKSDTPASKPKWIPGQYEITYTPNRTSRIYIIRADGALVSEDGKEVHARIQLKNGALIIDFGDRLERLTFADSRLFIEHFWPKGDYERNVPNQIGIGELVKKK